MRKENNVEIRIYTKQRFLKHGKDIAVFNGCNPKRIFSPGLNIRYKREFWKISYIASGSGILVVNEKRYPMQSGFIFLVRPDDLTTFELDEDVRLYTIVFTEELIEQLLGTFHLQGSFFSFFKHLSPEGHKELKDQRYMLEINRRITMLIREMRKEFLRDEQNSPVLLRTYLVELLVQLERLSERQFPQKRKHNLADYVTSLLTKDYQNDFDYHKTADELGITHIHLCSAYKKATGLTIGQMQLKIRLDNAKRMLLENDTSVSEISSLCGFNNVSYFYRAFRKEYGMPPREFQLNHGHFA